VPNHVNSEFWQGKKVFVTGHTGFKGSWLCLWLHSLGAQVTGYALQPPTDPNLFEGAGVSTLVHSILGDIRDRAALEAALQAARPEIVIHMAAQALVRDSYTFPIETYATNVMGTAHLLEAIRTCATVRAVVVVTTDKCYENKEWVWAYREGEPLGGYDPYSSSKACAELVTGAYRDSFFNPATYEKHGLALASARAGNVIGGGDWAANRLVPDCLRALLAGEEIPIRFPAAIRPWQHVLEPLSGYLRLAELLYERGPEFSGAWNFGPSEEDARPVGWIVQRLCEAWQGSKGFRLMTGEQPHEAHHLKLDCSKARSYLGWRPTWSLDEALASIVAWTLAYQAGQDLRALCLGQIQDFTAAGAAASKPPAPGGTPS